MPTRNMQKNMHKMSFQEPENMTYFSKICDKHAKYAKFVIQKNIYRIYTPHFADGCSGAWPAAALVRPGAGRQTVTVTVQVASAMIR
jgi:hypothetical protein